MNIKVSDYIVQTLVSAGVVDVFMLTGGGAMHLNDSFGKHPSIYKTFFHHEQSCTIAAESYFRLSNRLPVVNVTSGPGGTNAITGVYGAWVDSIGMIVVSGQVKLETMVGSTSLPLRQLGDQEVDIIRLVESITKYAVVIKKPETIRYHLNRALYLARNGRPGPVWLDIPVDVQGVYIDPDTLLDYEEDEDNVIFDSNIDESCSEILYRLQAAKRPVILVGSGVRLSGMHTQCLDLVDKLKVPVTTAWNSNDLVPNNNPYYTGRPGTVGDRSGNFTVQNADFLLVLGCRLNIRMISYNRDDFARQAFKVIVDIDADELQKPTIRPDLPVHADLRCFLPRLLAMDYIPSPCHSQWLDWCRERRYRYPVVQPEYWQSKAVNNYCFIQTLCEELDENDVVVTANGAAAVVTFQAAIIKNGQRLYHNSGSAPMGYDLPAAIGACIAHGRKKVICIAGDGSIQLNIQEMQTIVSYGLPIKIFILNNNGYFSIKQTQKNYFNGRFVGCDPDSGVGIPDFEKIASAYGILYSHCKSHVKMRQEVRAVLDSEEPQICEVFLDLSQGFAPKLASRQQVDGRIISPSLEDMHPFLSSDELKKNMLIPLIRQ